MATKKSTKSADKPAVIVQFPGAFTLFKPSMQALWRNVLTLLEGTAIFGILICITILAILLATGNNESMKPLMIGLAGVAGVLSLIVGVILSAGYTALQLKSSEGRTVSLHEMYTAGKHFALPVLGINVLVMLILVVSFVALIVPFFFMLRRYYLAPYFLVDRNLGVIEALKASAAESKRYSGAVWGLIGVTVIIGAISYIPFLGAVIAPVANLLYSFAPAVRYVQIREAATDGKIVTGVDTAVA